MEKEIKFSIGGGSEGHPIYKAVDVHPQRWNGWLVPIVSMETAEQIAKDIFDPSDLSDESPYHDIREAITEAKENFEDTVNVGCGFIWDLVEEQN